MHKQSFAECHSLATKAPLTRPSMHFSSKIPEVSKKNFWSFQLKPQEFKQKIPGVYFLIIRIIPSMQLPAPK